MLMIDKENMFCPSNDYKRIYVDFSSETLLNFLIPKFKIITGRPFFKVIYWTYTQWGKYK